MTVRRFIVPVTTDGSGDAEVYSPVLSGKLLSIRYLKDSFDDGVDFDITTEDSGQTLWAEDDVNASATRRPRGGTQGTDGADALFAALGEGVLDLIEIAQERIKVVVASGGDTASGSFHIVVDG